MKALFKKIIRKVIPDKVIHRLDKAIYRLNIYKFTRKYIDRHKLKKLVKNRPLKIIVGAGGVAISGWISTDIDQLNLLKRSDWDRYFCHHSIDAMLAEHVWEHLSKEEGMLAAKLCFQYLKRGAYIRVAVPDGFHPDPEYIEWVRPGGVGPGAKDHKILCNYKSFKKVFESIGFIVKMLEYFDEKGEYFYNEWNPDDGIIHRSMRFDWRNKDGKLNYTSIILDAFVPEHK